MKLISILSLVLTALLVAFSLRPRPQAPVSSDISPPPQSEAVQIGSLSPVRPAPSVQNKISVPEQKQAVPLEQRWQPSAKQQHVLDEARKDEEDWENQREKFLNGELKLSEAEQQSIQIARKAASDRENKIMARRTQSAEEESNLSRDLRANRQGYENQLKFLMGQPRYQAYVSFYRGRWHSDSIGAHLPLK